MAPRPDADPNALLPLAAHDLQILLALLERDMHGYALIDAIETRTGGQMQLGTSTVYAALTRLQKLGVIAHAAPPADADSNDARRRYYGLTAFGREVVRAEAHRIRRLNRMIADARVLAPTGGRGGA